MKKLIFVGLLCFINLSHSIAQLDKHHHDHEYIDAREVYSLDTKQELCLILGGASLNLLGRILITNGAQPNIDEINQLDASDLPFFDRSATDNNSLTAQNISDALLYTSVTLPFLTYLKKHSREEMGPIALMGLETFIINAGVTNVTKGWAKRYRPFNYNPEVDIDQKLSTGSRASFFSGHASTASAMSFFAASVLLDTHPHMKKKWLVWATAAVVPGTVGYLRYLSGKHFLSDITTGYFVGAGIGLLIPRIHKNDQLNITVNPTGGVLLNFTF